MAELPGQSNVGPVYLVVAIADWRADGLPDDAATGERGHHCDRCDREVWFDPESWKLAAAMGDGDAEVVCSSCMGYRQ